MHQMNFLLLRRRIWLFLLLASLVAAFIGNLHIARATGMSQMVPGWHIGGIIAELSSRHFSNPRDFTALTDVHNTFVAALKDTGVGSVNSAITNTLKLPRENISTSTMTLGADDKGVVDWVLLSFTLFGENAESLLKMYFLLLGASCALFALTYWRSAAMILVAIVFLLAHMVQIPITHVNPELQSVLALRFMPVMSMLACLHLVMAPFQRSLRCLPLACMLGQAMVISLVFHVRSSTFWQFGLIILACLIVGFFVSRNQRMLLPAPQPSKRLHSFFVTLAPAIILALGLAAVVAVQHSRLAEDYRSGKQIAGHVIWHSFYTGLAFHPVLGPLEGIRVDDVSVMKALGKYLEQRGRSDEFEDIGGYSLGFSKIQFAPYDLLVKEMLVDTCSKHLQECVSATLYYRPLALLEYLAWFHGFISELPYPELVDSSALSAFRTMGISMSDRKSGLRLFQASVIGILLLTTFGFMLSKQKMNVALIATLFLAIGASSPPILIYPMPHTIGEISIATSMLILLSLILCLLTVMQRIFNRRLQEAIKESSPL